MSRKICVTLRLLSTRNGVQGEGIWQNGACTGLLPRHCAGVRLEEVQAVARPLSRLERPTAADGLQPALAQFHAPSGAAYRRVSGCSHRLTFFLIGKQAITNTIIARFL